MEWIDREIEFPECDKILCYANGDIFISALLETKWGNHYFSTDWNHNEHQNILECTQWTHWMPLPEPPKCV